MICRYTDPAYRGRSHKVFDANGLEWRYVIECDTETGRIVRYKLNERGNLYVDRSRQELATETVYGTAPLLIVEKAK